MAVFTAVSLDDLTHWIEQFPLGKAIAIKGIASGIENSNFFITTERGEFVLTIFENLSFEQLPFYLQLMRHLAERGVLVPAPVANDRGELVVPLHGKPAAIVSKLDGSSQMDPQPAHCAAVGAMVARMHLAARDFPLSQPNLRGLDWWNETTPQVLPFLRRRQRRPAARRDGVPASVCRRRAVPAAGARPGARRPVPQQRHVRRRAPDRILRFLFRRLRHLAVRPGRHRQRLVHRPGHRRARRARACARCSTPTTRCARSPPPSRRRGKPMLRAAALRFWLSRLYDFYLPREAEMLTPHDPAHFERILRERIATPAPGLFA